MALDDYKPETLSLIMGLIVGILLFLYGWYAGDVDPEFSPALTIILLGGGVGWVLGWLYTSFFSENKNVVMVVYLVVGVFFLISSELFGSLGYDLSLGLDGIYHLGLSAAGFGAVVGLFLQN